MISKPAPACIKGAPPRSISIIHRTSLLAHTLARSIGTPVSRQSRIYLKGEIPSASNVLLPISLALPSHSPTLLILFLAQLSAFPSPRSSAIVEIQKLHQIMISSQVELFPSIASPFTPEGPRDIQLLPITEGLLKISVE